MNLNTMKRIFILPVCLLLIIFTQSFGNAQYYSSYPTQSYINYSVPGNSGTLWVGSSGGLYGGLYGSSLYGGLNSGPYGGLYGSSLYGMGGLYGGLYGSSLYGGLNSGPYGGLYGSSLFGMGGLYGGLYGSSLYGMGGLYGGLYGSSLYGGLNSGPYGGLYGSSLYGMGGLYGGLYGSSLYGMGGLYGRVGLAEQTGLWQGLWSNGIFQGPMTLNITVDPIITSAVTGYVELTTNPLLGSGINVTGTVIGPQVVVSGSIPGVTGGTIEIELSGIMLSDTVMEGTYTIIKNGTTLAEQGTFDLVLTVPVI